MNIKIYESWDEWFDNFDHHISTAPELVGYKEEDKIRIRKHPNIGLLSLRANSPYLTWTREELLKYVVENGYF